MIIGRPPKLTPEQQAKLHEWARIGTNRTQAARYFGVCVDTVSAYLARKHKRPIR